MKNKRGDKSLVLDGKTKYRLVTIPENKPKTEYKWYERRAELMKFMLAAGTPRFASQETLAKEYGVSQSQISFDLIQIRKEVYDFIGEDIEIDLELGGRRAVKNLLMSDNPKDQKEGVKLAIEIIDALQGLGYKKRAPQKVELSGATGQILTDADFFNAFEKVRQEEQQKKEEPKDDLLPQTPYETDKK